MADNEVRTRLTLDDGASKPLDEVENKVEDVERAEKEANSSLKEWAQTAAHAAQAIGVNLADVVRGARDVAMGFISAGANAEAGDHAVAALVKTAQGKDAQTAIDMAEELGDAIDEIAIGAGIAGDNVGNAFQIILEKTGASAQGIERATHELDSMSVIAGKLDKDVGAIAQEFAFMQEGQLKVKGQLFQLLQSTGIFGNDSKKAVEAWSKLSEEKRVELLSYGLDKLSGSMRDMPPTFKQAEAGLENMVRISKEAIGQPLLDELTPAIEEVTRELIRMSPEITAFGHTMAKDVAAGVREGGKMLRDAINWLAEHKDELAMAFRDGAEQVRKVVTFILDHKEEIAFAFGAKAVAPAVGKGVSAVGGVIGTMNKAEREFGAYKMSGAMTTVASMAALSTAIIAVGLAADQTIKLLDELADAEDTRQGGMKKLMDLAEAGDLENVRNTVDTMKQLDLASGKLDDRMRKFYDNVLATAEAASRNKAESSDSLRRQIEIASAAINDTYAKSIGDQSAAGAAWAANMTQNQLAILVNAYNQAAKNNDTAMMQLAASTIAGSGLVSEAFLKANNDIVGGFDKMADVLMSAGSGFGSFISQLRGKGPTTPKAPVLNLNGGQTFNIKQDFRQQDPDRVAVLFRRDIARMAGRKLQSSFSGPFGG